MAGSLMHLLLHAHVTPGFTPAPTSMPMPMIAELRQRIARSCQAGRTMTAIPRLSLVRADSPSEPMQCVYEPLVCVIVQGAKRILMGEDVLDAGPGSMLLAAVDLPVAGAVSQASADAPYLGLCLTLPPAEVAALQLEMPAHRWPDEAPGPGRLGLSVAPTPDELLDPLLRLMRLLDQPQDIAVLAPMIEREILYRLLCSPQGHALRQLAGGDSRQGQIRRAIDWIRTSFAEPLRIEEAAGIARMSPSSFHRHFKSVTAMSPLQYQKQIRLQEARRLLLASSADAASVAYAVGYESPSQFSREYRRMFGAPPGRDLARLRGAPRATEQAAMLA